MDFEQVEKIADALAKTHMQNPCSFSFNQVFVILSPVAFSY